MQRSKSRYSLIEDSEDDTLNNTSSPSIADSKCYSDNSEKLDPDPYEMLDGGLEKKTSGLKLNKRNSEQPIFEESEFKKSRLNTSICSEVFASEGFKKEDPEISDQTISINQESKISSTGDPDFTFLNNFFWYVRDDDERKASVICYDACIFEIYHSIRKKSFEIPVPRIFIEMETIPLPNPMNAIFDAETLRKNCSTLDRRKVILKLFSRRNGLKLTSETLHLGVGILDKCLNLLNVVPETLVDLAAMTIVLASKIEEVNFLTLRDALVCDLTREKSIKMLGKLEQFVLKTLDYKVSFPTPLTFANYLLVTLGSLPSKINMTHYLLELSLLSVTIRQHPSDHIAHAATCLAYGIDCDSSSTPVKSLIETENKLKTFSRVSPGTTRNVMRVLLKAFQSASLEVHEIYKEYERAARDSVALRTINNQLIDFLSMK